MTEVREIMMGAVERYRKHGPYILPVNPQQTTNVILTALAAHGYAVVPIKHVETILGRLEYDASWDKVGSAYYELKAMIREAQEDGDD